MFLKKFMGLTVLCAAVLGLAQEDSRIALKYSDPGKPGLIEAALIAGGFEVYPSENDEIVIVAREPGAGEPRVSSAGKTEGMRVLPQLASGLKVEEADNVVKVSAKSWNRPVDLIIYAPRETSLKLRCVNDGDILVEGLSGEFDLNNVNGAVSLKDVTGSVVAHALNRDLTVTFARVAPDKAMSFTTLNGDIDVAFPRDLRADLELETKYGEIHSEFELKPRAVSEAEARRYKGRMPIRLGKSMTAAINGGGPVMTFKTMNGDVKLRIADR